MQKKWLLIAFVMMLLVSCGPKWDVSLFVMSESGMDQEMSESIQKSIQGQLGETPTVAVLSSSIFSRDRIVVEVAAGSSSIMLIPEADFKGFAEQGGMIVMDDLFKAADFPEGVVEAAVDSKGPDAKETHLYGIPVSKSKLFVDAGYKGKELIAFVLPRVKNRDQAMQVMTLLAER